MNRYSKLVQEFNEEGDFLTFQEHPDWLRCYEKDSGDLISALPLLVYRPYSIDTLSRFICSCALHSIPLRVRCGGTSMNASSVAGQEGIIILTSHFNNIIEYNCETGKIVPEPGVTISQLNDFVRKDGWEFPLDMAVNGVAGIGSCLSCRATGYLQIGSEIYNAVRKVVLIDGKGELLEVPWSLVCGAEGIFGVLIRIELQLSRMVKNKLFFAFNMPVEEIRTNLTLFKQQQCLKSISLNETGLFMGFEGEKWRLDPAIEKLKVALKPYQWEYANKNDFFLSRLNDTSVYLSAALPVDVLLEGKDFMVRLCEDLEFQYSFNAEFLTGSLQIHLSSCDSRPVFQAKLKQLMVVWIDLLLDKGGFPVSTHGVGKLWNAYMTPFIGEDDLLFLRRLQRVFDPHRIFARGHFLPEEGKSLVRIKDDRF